MTVDAARTRAGAARHALGTASRFRPDIEGLRAVAVLLVVLDHAGVPPFSGGYVGVDVFFVISGFLITALLLRERERTGTISIVGFYARRALRLLPAATVVLLATLAGAWLFLSPLRFVEFSRDAVAAASYWINLRLAGTGTDYLANPEPSPFQHFWSLTVEEQFYLVWPALLLLAATRRQTLAALAVLIAGSAVLSVTETARSAPWAYFGAHTRAWELGAGALIALVAARLPIVPRGIARTAVWAGLAAIGAAAVVFDEHTPFPGYAAALPVLGAVLVIAGGTVAPGNRLLGLPPMQTLGKLSYSWYLWHWPVLLIVPAGPVGKAGLAAGALVLALATYHLVEDPIRRRAALRRSPLTGVALGLALAAVSVIVALLAGTAPPPIRAGADARSLSDAMQRGDPARVLAAAIAAEDPRSPVPANLTPSLRRVADDKPRVYPDGCHLAFDAVVTPPACVYGDRGGPVTVALFGDSHAAQWFPALDRIARQRHWRLLPFTKSSCSAAATTVYQTTYKRAYTECDTWRKNTIETMRSIRPGLVVVTSSLFTGDPYGMAAGADPAEVWRDGWRATLGELTATGAKVAWIADTPFQDSDVPQCLAAHPDRIGACGVGRDRALRGPVVRAAVAADAPRAGVTVVEPLPWLCAATCPVVVGDVLVYRDSHHLTTVYAELLAPLLDRGLPQPAPS